MKISLVQEAIDIGFFDAYTLDTSFNYIQLSGLTQTVTKQNIKKLENVLSGKTTLIASGLVTVFRNSNVIGTTALGHINYNVTGTSSSRLAELRKYTITNNFYDQYVIGGGYGNDGVDISVSVPNGKIVYFIGGIRYIDILTGFTIGTTFSFISQGYSSPNYINVPVYKDMNKENIISNPKIANDVFIVRQELSAFDGNYRLEYIKSLVDLESYAGGGFFNIVNNT